MSSEEMPGLDLSKVAALQQKRTLAFVNHFVITTVQFLNNFMKFSEEKLMNFERKLERVEAAMVLLETRLSSIPEVNAKPETKTEQNPPEDAVPVIADDLTYISTVTQPLETSVEGSSSATSEPAYPEYDRFVKMVQVGVPLQAVKLKISSEGLDPDIFDRVLGKK